MDEAGSSPSYKLTKVHPSLAPEADQVGKYAAVLRERLRDDGLPQARKKVMTGSTCSHRIADVVIDLYAQIATLSRVTASIEKKGEEKARAEIEIARWFAFQARHRMVANLKALDRHRDAEATAISDRGLRGRRLSLRPLGLVRRGRGAGTSRLPAALVPPRDSTAAPRRPRPHLHDPRPDTVPGRAGQRPRHRAASRSRSSTPGR